MNVTDFQLHHVERGLSELRAERARRVKRMAGIAAEWAEKPRDDYTMLRFLDALQFCIDSDLSEDVEACQRELRVCPEGYPLDSEGDVIPGAERQFIPGER